MGDSIELVSGFWLPSEFLTDEDFVKMDKISSTDFSFPTEFPYHYKQHTDKNAENLWSMSTSPQSGAENDVISRAESGVAMLKLNNGGGDRFGVGLNMDTRFMGPHSCFFRQPKNPTPARQQSRSGVTYGQRQVYGNRGEMSEGAWTMQQNPTRIVSGREGVKRGTGVFLPRPCKYQSNNFSESRVRQPGGGSTNLIPDRAAAHASNNSIENVAGFSRSHFLSQPMFNRGFIQDYDLLMVRRHALMLRQQRSLLLAERSSIISRETCLPQEWTY